MPATLFLESTVITFHYEQVFKKVIKIRIKMSSVYIYTGWGRHFEKVSKDTDTVLTDIHMIHIY